jgi:uncharacterized peroxidase-related enzyme
MGDFCRVTTVAYIEQISDEDARGLLAELYEQARKRAGRVYNILRIQSQSPRALRAMIELYMATMFGPSPLSRAQREMLAVVVSRANRCHY